MVDTAAIRLRACATAPYLAAALYNMHLIIIDKDDEIAMKACPTMGVDKWWRCYINPDFAEKLGVKISANIFIHEVYHLISNHAGRAEAKGITRRTHLAWNIAADCAINQDLKRMGLELFDGVFYPHMIDCKDGELAEFYYDKIMENAIEIPCDMWGEGSGVSGEQNPGEGFELGGNEGDKHEKVQGNKGDVIRQKVAQDVQEAANSGIGNVPAGMKRWADNLLDPQVDWLTKFNSAVRGQMTKHAGMVDFTYSRISRRSTMIPGIIFPKMVQPIPDVSLILDTSGSMGEEDLRLSLGEARGVIDSLGCPVDVFAAETTIHEHQRVWSVDEIELLGGGGTDMAEAIREVAELMKPSIIIVISDGLTGWPAVMPPNVGSIIALITRKGTMDKVPSFIETIELDIGAD